MDNLKENQKFKYIDDLSILEVINLILAGIPSYNVKQQVPSDIQVGNKFIHSQSYISEITKCSKEHQMKLNCEKSNYMVFNFSHEYQFNTRLCMNQSQGILFTGSKQRI